MVRLLFGLAMSALTIGIVTYASADYQPPGKGEKGGEKGEKKGPMGKDGKGPMGKGFQLGKVLPPFAYDELNLTETQSKQIADLEKEVKTKLEKILTPAQKKKLEELRPPMGPGGPGGKGGPPGGPGGPPGGPGGPGEQAPPPRPEGEQALAEQIQWYAVLGDAQKEALRLGKPMLLTTGTPHCSGISGIW